MRIHIDGDLKFYLSEDETVLTMYDDDNEIQIHMFPVELESLRREIR